MSKTVMIDPGHGGKFSGAKASHTDPFAVVNEKDINLQVASKVRYFLEENHKLEVFMTRESDKSLADKKRDDLQGRVDLERMFEPDCFVSIHCNAASVEAAHGFEVFTSVGETGADPFAQSIIDRVMIDVPGTRLRADLEDGDSDREANFYVLRKTKSPAALIELGFLSNAQDRARLIDEGWQNMMAEAIAKGVSEWVNREV